MSILIQEVDIFKQGGRLDILMWSENSCHETSDTILRIIGIFIEHAELPLHTFEKSD